MMISDLATAQPFAADELTFAARPVAMAGVRPLAALARGRRFDVTTGDVASMSQAAVILNDTCGGAMTANDHVSSFSAKWFAGYPTTAKKDHSQRERPT